MTAYYPAWTARVRIKYTIGRFSHNIILRFPGPSTGSGLTDVMTAFGDFLTALQPLMYDDFTVVSAAAADIDSTVFLPIANTLTPVGGIASATRQPDEEATAWSFVARTTGGNPWKFSLFGLFKGGIESAGGTDYRINFGENGDIDAALSVLNLNSTAFIGNDAQPLHWFGYVDYKDNDHFVKQIRP
jgi:hypothetical protein